MPKFKYNPTDKVEYINCNSFNLPDHTEDLNRADNLLTDLKSKIDHIKQTNIINDKLHTNTYEEVIVVLDWIGRMSMPLFSIEDELEDLYTKQYKHSPALGNKLFNDHYENIHHPYTVLKHRAYWLLEQLDFTYQDKFKKNPPNWNI